MLYTSLLLVNTYILKSLCYSKSNKLNKGILLSMHNINEEEIESGCLGSLCLLFYRLFKSANRIQSQHFRCIRRSEALYSIRYSESSDDRSDNDSSTSYASEQQYIADTQSVNTNLPRSKLKNF